MYEPDVEDGEYALRAHIRQLLLSYAVNHISTDYIQLTEQAVSDLWSQYLVEIPTTDPHSLLLPTDPFETLTRIHGLGSIGPFFERFQSTPSAIHYIKNLRKTSGNLKSRSAQVAFEESRFESHRPLCPPMSPILTRRATRETPRPASNKFLKSLPHSHPEFLASQAIKPLEIESVLEPSVKQDEVLNTNFRLSTEEQNAVRSLVRSVLAPRPKGCKNRYLDLCARPDSPPLPSRVPEAPFIPIFPRRRRAGSGVREGSPTPSGLKGLPAVIPPPVKVEELEPELHEQNMVIVDGWHAYRSSPSPTPTPPSSQEDQIDELIMSSPNTTPPPVRPRKMEVVQIPRTKRIGGVRKKPAPIGHGKDLGTFLIPLVPKLRAPDPLARLSPEPATSIMGQPDSACGAPTDREDFDDDFGRLYNHQKQDPRDLILREKIDEKRQLLMEVPALPPPTEHPPNALFLPSYLKDFVAPLKTKGQANIKIPTHKFLKKAKGIPSLNVELSWVPIAAKTRIPTDLEIMNLAALFDADAPSSDLPTQIGILLDQVSTTFSPSDLQTQDTWSHRYAKNFELISEGLDPGIARCEIILSRKERRRAAGLPDEDELEMEVAGCAVDTEDALTIDDRCAKRQRLAQDGYLDDSGIAFNRVLDLDHGSPTSHPFYGDAELDPLNVDKENLPPYHGEYDDLTDSSTNKLFDPEKSPGFAFPGGTQSNRDDLSMASVYEHREFEALSFDSHQATSAQPTQIPADYTPSDETYADPPSATPSAPEIAIRSLGIAEFAKLRAKKVNNPAPESQLISEANRLPEEPSHSIPENVYDRNTLRLPTAWNFPGLLHRYMVSMELVQKQGLVRSLRSRTCSIDLVERDALGGVDIVLDPHTAIIFTNLLILPSECSDLTSRIAQQSWCYSRLLIIFEAYPAARSYQSSSSTASELFAYSPPIIKALGKLKRDLGIAEGCGSKRQACLVQYAFADTVDEAAMFTRYFGDFAEANDESRGCIWGEREWLDDDVPEVPTIPAISVLC
ncbi:hypothetical protein FB451DRAFT_1222613 [Mycena latifolia]|nr:hypothetical protein FB451DRAFT_1222613 [Mycena latifolia]